MTSGIAPPKGPGDDELIERLNAKTVFGTSRLSGQTVNPDGPAAASRIAELKAEREWMPIETAPKDGTHILAYIPFEWASGKPASHQDVIAWDERAGSWYSRTAPNYVQLCDPKCLPTHWIALSNPPSGEVS